MELKLLVVCLTSNCEFVCIKCNKRMPLTERHWKGTFIPDKPLVPNTEKMGYVYALCVKCFEEIKDKETGIPDAKWRKIFEDEITEIVTLKKNRCFNVKDSGLSDQEISALGQFIMTGRIQL